MFVLVLSLGILSACGGDEVANVDENAGTASDGSTWYYGDKAPAESLGKTGDYYLNTETRESYVKEGKTWRVAAEGEVCNWYYGTDAPDETTAGEVNDFYLDTRTGNLYQKTEEGWKPILTLKGENGRNGVMWFSGKGAPGSVADALENDFYLNTTTFEVYQYHKDETGALTWGDPLGTLKGEQGQNAKEPMHFYDGYGDPNVTHPVDNPQEGDLFLGRFSGVDEDGPTGEGSGSRLYRYHEGKWDVLMESMNSNVISIYNYDQLVTLAKNVQSGKNYAGMEVHLKKDIDFNDLEPASLHRAVAALAVADWTPIGTAGHPFKGIFDGEGNTIRNFKTTVSTDATEVGFFGNIDGATIQNLHFVDVIVDATEVDGSAEDKFVGAVVVGQAQGDVTVKNVTVTNASVETAEGMTEEKAPAVGGLVGKLESTDPEKETTLKVEGSSVEGSGTTDLVADKGKASENVTITDSSVTDGEGNQTVWDEGGNHYAEDEEKNRTYLVGSAKDLENLLSTAEAGKPVSVTLESDLTLAGTAEESFTLDLAGKDLVLDLAGNDLTLNSEEKNAQFTVSGGSKLTVTDQTGTGVVHMGRVENQPVISVSGAGSALNLENVKVEVKNTYDCKNTYNSYIIAPAIVAENGGTVNIGGGSNITVEGPKETNDPENYRGTNYKEPQLAAVSGKGSVINIDDENTVINLTHATGIYAEKEGTINFKNGTLNMTGGGCCVGLGFGTGAGEIVFSGGIINIEGDITGKHMIGEGMENVAIAIGSTQQECDNAQAIVNGGTINLAPTSGIAIAFGGGGANEMSYMYVGDGTTINLNATESGKAYVASSTQGFPSVVINVYADTEITGENDERNFTMPGLFEYIAGGEGRFCGGSVSFRSGNLPDQYTKKTMGIVTE